MNAPARPSSAWLGPSPHQTGAAVALCLLAGAMWIGHIVSGTRSAAAELKAVTPSTPLTPAPDAHAANERKFAPWPRGIARDVFAVPFEPAAVSPGVPAEAPVTLPPQPGALSLLRVQAILYSPGHSQAVINGRPVREGDEIEGFRVLAIEPKRVLVVTGDAPPVAITMEPPRF